jgi:hypothetical protein
MITIALRSTAADVDPRGNRAGISKIGKQSDIASSVPEVPVAIE